MTYRMQLFEFCKQKGLALMEQANDFIKNDMIQQYQNKPCSRVEYGANSRYMPRGYYCPSIALDTVITNAKRGKLLKRLTQRSKPTHCFHFDESGKLIMVETKAPFPETTEYIIYEQDRILGFSINAHNTITGLSEEIYEQGVLKNYFFAALTYTGKSVDNAFYELYDYKADELNTIDHFHLPYYAESFIKKTGFEKLIWQRQLHRTEDGSFVIV